jgi:ATP/maltotriose-dependent transcriptional regulator MalT
MITRCRAGGRRARLGGVQPGLIDRHDLVAALDRALGKRMTVISALAGSGKTSLLSVSLNTVSTHIRRIYAKLGATDRSSAVQRARELRLLSGNSRTT